MRLLIDECIDERFRLLLSENDCQTVRYAGLAGLKNGRLLDAAEAAGFQALITVDRSIPDQQNFSGRKISVVVLIARTNRLRDLTRNVPSLLAALRDLKPGSVVSVR